MRINRSLIFNSTPVLLLFLMIAAFCFPQPVRLSVSHSPALTQIPLSRSSLTVDGKLDDRIWKPLTAFKLEQYEPGVPEESGGEIRFVLRGDYLCLGAFLPEPGGKILAKSIGYNPVWARNAHGSPELEDRVICRLLFDTPGGGQSELKMEINPWGALRLERDNTLVQSTGIMAASGITTQGWCVEAAVPLDETRLDRSSRRIKISFTRVRSRRALAPEYRWKLTGAGQFLEFILSRGKSSAGGLNAPLYSPPLIGNTEIPLEVGRVRALPPLDASWDDPFWKTIPAFELQRNEPFPRRPDYPTKIKWVHDRKTLAIFFRCAEDERVDCDTGARDGSVGSDDHVFIYLATTGSSVIEIQVNPAGAVRDAKAKGPHMYRSSSGAWNGNIKTHCDIFSNTWTARVDLPLDEIASSLGELDIPSRWRVLIGRDRQARIGTTGELSTIPVIGNPYLLAPARFRSLKLTDLDPTRVYLPEPADERLVLSGLAAELAGLRPHVFSRVQKKYHNLSGMLENSIRERIRTLAMSEHAEWDGVNTLKDWERFRDKRIEALKKCLGEFPRQRPSLEYQVTGTFKGEGFQVKNILYQGRPHFYVAANLYLPLAPADNMPGIIIIPSHHYPKTQGEMKDCGMLWARTGCAVLVIERLGAGERTETLPWHRQHYQSEYLVEMQLELIGQTRMGWMAWDAIRAVDLLYEIGNIDRERIILIGSVAGGGIPAAIAGIFDQRLDAVIPFNFGRVFWWDWGIPSLLAHKVTPWFIYNAIAPRKFIYAHEFSWEGEEGPEYPSVWVPAWPRYKKVYSLYGAEQNLATTQGTGLLRVQATAGDCYSIGPAQRKPIFPVLKKWFGIPVPSVQDQNIKIDSELSFARIRPDYAALKIEEQMRRMPDTLLLSITPAANSGLTRKALHRIAWETGKDLLQAARENRNPLDQFSGRQELREGLARVLGNIQPVDNPKTQSLWTKKLSVAVAEALVLHTEPGILVPVLILKPTTENGGPYPLVLAVSEGGKERFLENRSEDIARLIQSGFAVCLPDVRGTGETAPGQYNRASYLSSKELALGNTLLGARLKDLRTVLACMLGRDDIDAARVGIWGDSFTPLNPENIWLDELVRWPVSPQMQNLASPLGAYLALLTALFHEEIKTVAVRGGLAGYLSILENNITYIPADMTVPEILKVGDINDICAYLAPRPLLVESFVDGKNRLVRVEQMAKEMEIARRCYQQTGAGENFLIREKSAQGALVSWLVDRLSEVEPGFKM